MPRATPRPTGHPPAAPLLREAPYPGRRALGLAGVAGFLLFASYIQVAGTEMFWPTRVTLNSEMTLGAWWSSVLLILAAVVTLSVACSAKRHGLPAYAAMVGLGVVLVALSVDEIASLHERYDDANIVIPRLLRLPPIAVVLAVTLAYALWQFWTHRNLYGSVWLFGIFAGFGLMGSVYGIELLEHRVHWPEAFKPTRLVIEEGIELLGMSLLLLSMLRVRLGIGDERERADADLRAAWTAGLMLAVLAVPMIVLQQLAPSEGSWLHWGHPGLAAPALLLAVGAFAAFAAGRREATRRPLWWAIGVALLLASVETTVSLKALAFRAPVDPTRPDYQLLALGGLFVVAGVFTRQRASWLIGLAVVVVNLTGFAVYKTPIVQLGVTAGAALLLLAVARPVGVMRRLRLSDPDDGSVMVGRPAAALASANAAQRPAA